MKKYYCLTLLGSYETDSTIACNRPCTHIQDVLEKEYTTLDFNTLRDDFLMKDERIVVKDNSWIIRGAFPVIAEEIDGKMVDVITGEVIEEFRCRVKVDTLSYVGKSKITTAKFVKAFLEMLDAEGIERYRSALNGIKRQTAVDFYQLETPRYYKLELAKTTVAKDGKVTTESAGTTVYAEELNGTMVEIVTKEPIYCEATRTINSKLTYTNAATVSSEEIETYLKHLGNDEEALKAHIETLKSLRLAKSVTYNNYTTMDMPRISKDREEHAKTQSIQETIVKSRGLRP